MEEKDWACGLVLKFCRDNPVWRDRADAYKRGLFILVKQFFDRYHVGLSLETGVFGKCRRRKYSPTQMSVERALKVLGALKQREKTVCLLMLQSGQSVDAILNHFSLTQLSYVEGCIKNRQNRIRLDFPERKGNGLKYFSFISVDAIQELKKWLILRNKWLKKVGRKNSTVFITRSGEALTVNKFTVAFNRRMRDMKLSNGPFSLTSHMFRKLFKTESSPPERGIRCDYVEFMMGHLSGIESVGGIYDRTPEIHEGIVEKEYAKLEAYVNVYNGKRGEADLSDEERAGLKLLGDPRVKAMLLKQMRQEGYDI